jgi:hypothetical protein
MAVNPSGTSDTALFVLPFLGTLAAALMGLAGVWLTLRHGAKKAQGHLLKRPLVIVGGSDLALGDRADGPYPIDPYACVEKAHPGVHPSGRTTRRRERRRTRPAPRPEADRQERARVGTFVGACAGRHGRRHADGARPQPAARLAIADRRSARTS